MGNGAGIRAKGGGYEFEITILHEECDQAHGFSGITDECQNSQRA